MLEFVDGKTLGRLIGTSGLEPTEAVDCVALVAGRWVLLRPQVLSIGT